jgi:hypothetical protein
MDKKTPVKPAAGYAVASALVATVLVVAGGTVTRADQQARDLVGVWTVQVTLRDCATDAPLGPPFQSLGAYHLGGTLADTTASLAFAIGQRSAAFGTWTREGRRRYTQNIVALILFDTSANLPNVPGFDPTKPVTPGFRAGWQAIQHAIRLTDDDHWTSQGTNAFYDINGDLYRTGCSTATAQRVQ